MTTIRKPCPPSFRTFGLAIQALVVLASNEHTCPSCTIADQLQSEATLLRKILATLARASLIETREGRDGGYRLLRPAEQITLAEVYQALQISEELGRSMEEATGSHPFGIMMQGVFASLVAELDESTMKVLEKHTIAELISRA
ncbi:transcriptional regulator, BadM/Rrf2 family [Paenibacillus curdlanolyticus YK9]|uniref:Transcriptional regulator, BadM/Rrf2 family n=1 Tax=Paenibacillus curdlanolyticus YK9 TaxID=717606 RepID=E0ICP4_9BACL|nr:Rrf2 family transcriptional regulator [Paenibacillus curdlanolyticus]EFM09930.1 transcriptional regulator, BadM/Rrf2 family [Paenibacillus curdlanolyticus YK9]